VYLKRLIPLYLGAAIGPMGGIGIVPLIPVLAGKWSVEFTTATLAITLYLVPFIIIQVFSGSIAQVFDVRKTLLFGFSVYALGGILCGLSPNLWALLGSRIVQGIGAGFLTPIIMALIGEVVPERHVGKAIGGLGVAYTVGVTLGPLFSGLIEVHMGWSWFFYFLASISILSGLFYRAVFPAEAPVPREADATRAVLPLLRRALGQPGVMLVSLGAFTLFIAFIGIMTFTADHLKTNLHLPSDRVGALLSVTGLSGIFVSPVAGLLADRVGRMKVFLAGTLIAFLALGAMSLVKYTYPLYFTLFMTLGVGTATAWTTLNTMGVQLSVALRKPVTSLYNAVKFSGYALAPVLLAVLYAPMGLKAVQWGCMGAVAVSSALAVMGDRRAHGPGRDQAPPGR